MSGPHISARRTPSTTTILLVLISLVIAAVIAQLTWTIWMDRELTIELARKEELATIRSIEEHAFQTIQDADRAIATSLEEIANAGTQILSNERDLRRLLIRQRQSTAHIQSLRFVTTAGISAVTTFEFSTEKISVLDREYVQYMLAHPEQREPYVGNPLKSRYDGTWLLPVVRNIHAPNGTRLGLLCAYLKLDYFNDFYRLLAEQRNATISMHSDSGIVMLRWPFDDRVLGSDISNTQSATRILAGPREGAFEAERFIGDARPVLLAYRKIAGLPLTMVYAVSLNEILLPWKQRTHNRLLVGGAFVAMMAMLTFFLLTHMRRLKRSEQALASSENRYRMLYESATDPIFLINRANIYVDCNPAALNLFNLTDKAQLIGRNVTELSAPSYQSPESRVDPVALIAAAFAGEPQLFEWPIVRSGQLFFNEITLSCGSVNGEQLLFAVFRDINARKRAEYLQESQNQILHMITAGIELPAILGAVTAFLSRHAPTTSCMVLLVKDDQSCFTAAVGPDLPAAFLMRMSTMAIADEEHSICEAVLTKCPVMVHDFSDDDFPHLPANCSSWPIMDQRGQILGVFSMFQGDATTPSGEQMQLIGIATDIASIAIESRRAEQRIRRMAHYDELTGLPNRVLFTQQLEKALIHALRHGKRVGVLFLDLDRFKNINDTFGHETGDSVLSEISERFLECMRGSDIIGRVGGDEFIVLVGDYDDPIELGEIAQRLLHAAALPFEIAGQECRLGTSIGIATFPTDGESAQMLLKNADVAMYRAKSTGKNNYRFYSAEMNIHSIERLALETRLRRAIERKEFVMHYQAKVNLLSGAIVGAEALVRWNHPERGLLYPNDFVALAEETGLISALGMLVLDITCADIVEFNAAGIDFGRIAINLSGSQFDGENLLNDLTTVVNGWKIDPACLEFEITESMVMHNREQAIGLMDGMIDLGFSLSIDDFGTGYSSLAYLKRFPVDSVKVDKSFINDIPGDPNDMAIVEAIIVMAHTLGLKVIAEGVETAIQLETLQAYGCDEYQGYFFSKPIPADDFIALATRRASLPLLGVA
jgi:diguanylate cyclase (GGDEF)-like protein/PAS domain S-box-containing protein